MRGITSALMASILGLYVMAGPTPAWAETAGGNAKANICATVTQLIDRIATRILNDSSDEAFDLTVKNILGEFCALRNTASGSPELLPIVDELTVAVFGWAWEVSSLMKFKAQRNDSAAGIAARGMKQRVTTIQTLCPAVTVPNISSVP